MNREPPLFLYSRADMVVDQVERYETYARAIKRILLFAGLWPRPAESNYLRLVIVIHVLTSLGTLIAIINFVTNHITNIMLVTKGLGTVVSFFTMLLKVSVFSMNQNLHTELHDVLERTFREDFGNPELRSVLLSPLKFFYRPTIWLGSSTWGIVLFFFFTPPISAIIQYSHGISPIRYRLPFPSLYPWDVTKNYALFSAHYFVEVLAGCALAGVTVATDALFGFYICQMSGQCRTLTFRMKNLQATDDYRAVIKECAVRHRTLNRCRSILERIYGPIILWLMMTSAINICAHIFQMSVERSALTLLFIIMKLMQTLLYAWYGLFLTTESEAFREAVYCSGWAGSGNRSYMTNVLTMLMYQPLVLTACHFSVISLDMFVAVANTALSYFFLLRTLHEPQ